MAYTPYYPGGWRNKPDLSTSIRAEALQHMDDGIEAAHDAIAALGSGGVSITDNGDGTWTASSGITDNGDGTWTA